MGKLRSINTDFWSDPFIEDLNSNEKLLFLYLITNDKNNMLGIYEISLNKISFETGIKKESIVKALEGFERLGKVKYIDNHIVLVNFLKNQKFNGNMKKSAVTEYNKLPKSLKFVNLEFIDESDNEGFETLCEGFGMVRKVEVEYEYEDKDKLKSEKSKISPKMSDEQFENFWKLYPNKVDKKKARIIFLKLKSELFELIVENLKIQIRNLDWETKDKKFIPHPTTWLNGERWNDYTPTKQNNGYIHKPGGKSPINSRGGSLYNPNQVEV